MTSTFIFPSATHPDYDHDNYLSQDPSTTSASVSHQSSTTPSFDVNDLSPYLSNVDQDFVPPATHTQGNTPEASSSIGHYQPSDFSELEEDPLLRADFNHFGGPSFLDESGIDATLLSSISHSNSNTNTRPGALRNASDTYPLTPDQLTASPSPHPQTRSYLDPAPSRLPQSISPKELQKPFKTEASSFASARFTPSQSNSSRSSEDGMQLAGAPLRSPRVTVSVWGQDHGSPRTVERTFDQGHDPETTGLRSAGDLISSQHDEAVDFARRDSLGRWNRDPTTGHAGLGPESRSARVIPSVQEQEAARQTAQRNENVDAWLATKLQGSLNLPKENDIQQVEQEARNQNEDDGIPLGDNTVNRPIPGQTYYGGPGGQMTNEDFDIINRDRNWADAPLLPDIRGVRHQPQSSQAAIERFNKMCTDTESILSRAATWGTRRRSFHSVLDLDSSAGVASGGSFLKKLSLARDEVLRGLTRKPSNKLKRSRSGSRVSQHDSPSPPLDETSSTLSGKRDSTTHLAPPERTSSWGKKQTPSINNALASMGGNMASIGTTHVKRGSVSGTPPSLMSSPKLPFEGLSVRNSLRRPRSKSELPRSPVINTSLDNSHPNIVQMLRQTGGPPVAALSKGQADPDDDDDDDDELDDEIMAGNGNVIDGITANFSGFREHVVSLNPELSISNPYLADRIAHQQTIRYKHLLNLKVKHLNMGANCPCGELCFALGGTANILDSKSDSKGIEALTSHLLDDDDRDAAAAEGAINPESFPPDIPMPPTQQLPAEFECQLCFSKKKFQKPSDWTKHVHEDVQPFTCTWDRCRDPKIFKRKADWVRHENEGHRQLEWWTCDVDDCRHVCYRRDNFLQHLVREHKFAEPKVKTKAAMKKSGAGDPTWLKVGQCHQLTPKMPQEEPCRFCGKTFPSWKKLTVHLAKHMEQISLPVLRLVAVKAKELAADTIISPVHDPPPQQPAFPDNTMTGFVQAPQAQMYNAQPGPPHYQGPGQMIFNQSMHMQTAPVQPQFVTTQHQYNNLNHVLDQSAQVMDPMTAAYATAQPATSMPYVHNGGAYIGVQDNNYSSLNPLGLQSVGGMPMGEPMGYEAQMVHPSSGHQSPFSGGSVSPPYTRSPHQPPQNMDVHGGQNRQWNERPVSGFF